MAYRGYKLVCVVGFFCSAVLFSMCPAWGETYTETPVQVTAEVSGAWIQPDSGWDGRTVLILHGLADDMNGPAGMTQYFAQELAKSGIASLRINFRGEGDRMRTDIESTLDTRVEDTEAAYWYLLEKEGVRVDRLGVEGASMGAATAIVTAGKHPKWFRSMAVWVSPSGDLYAGIAQGELKEVAEEAMEKGIAEYEFEGWKTVTFKADFFESFRGVNVDESLAKYPGAFLSVRGDRDFLPIYEPMFMKIATGEPREALLIGGADHIFDVFNPETDYDKRATRATVDWFLRTLN